MSFRKLLEVYTVDEILEMCGVEAEDVLLLLEEQGVLKKPDVEVPL